MATGVPIPRSAQWHALVEQRRSITYEQFARQRGMSRPIYRAGMEVRIQQWIRGRKVRVRVRSDDLDLILSDGRLKNQFEARRSGGAFNPALRIQTEAALFGISVNASALDRPIYGYLQGSAEPSLIQYGVVVLQLRDEAFPRTTFTMGDSLDHTLAGTQHLMAPEPLDAPTAQALHTDFDLLDAPSSAHATGYGYIECQIHGGVAVSDVQEVVMTQGLQPSVTLQERLNNADIELRIEQGDDV